MFTIKPLTTEDTQIKVQFGDEANPADLIVDATKIIILYNQVPSTEPLGVRYDLLRQALTEAYGVAFDDSTTYMVLEKSVQMVGELKKRLSS